MPIAAQNHGQDRPSEKPVAIIGGGFSGTLLAVQLARAGTRAVIVEREGAALGHGLAYGACGPQHLLNVRAANMSAFPDDPAHFLRWLGHGEIEAGGTSGSDLPNRFASRADYGRYLVDVLAQARAAMPGLVEVCLGTAHDVVPAHDGALRVLLHDGRALDARAVVLAQGNAPPAPHRALAGLPPPRVIADPWARHAFDAISPEAAVFLLGTGLTAIDVIQTLDARGHRGPILALSRRGLLPRAHADIGPVVDPQPLPTARGSALVAHVRKRARTVGWHHAIDELRPHTHALWQAHAAEGQARFLRHARPWWDVHRHRMAPQIARRIAALEAEGRLQVVAGSLEAAQAAGARLALRWRPRGTDAPVETLVDHAVICTGPDGNPERSRDPLLRTLLSRGAARACPQRLGLDIDPAWRLRDREGKAALPLYAMGTLTKGLGWEMVAVPDIRVQARDLAHHLARIAVPA